MPDIFYIDEKQHLIKHFDSVHKMIFKEKILIENHKIPMFTGIGSVQRRIFLFGGKETLTKAITNKSYEIKQKKKGFFLKPINRLIKNRSRSAVASVDQNINGFNPFIVVIGGSDQF